MLLGGGSNCQQCGCKSACEKCTRTCTNPHTGSAFQEVYQVWSFGAVNGLASDGYLTFSGDSDAAAGVMVGDGPFYQQIGGSFYLDNSATRFPCGVTVSFWRTLFPANATTDTALSSNTITVTCVTGQFLTAGGVLLNPGESYTYTDIIPLVGLFAGDPHTSAGTVSGIATCSDTLVSIQGRIAWSNSERIHGLHGIVRECYEEGNPCATACDGSQPPSTIYLAITNAAYTGGVADLSWMNGTYVLSRVPNFCSLYEGVLSTDCALTDLFAEQVDNRPLTARYRIDTIKIACSFIERISGVCQAASIEIVNTGTAWNICGTGSLFSGTGATVSTLPGATVLGTCDWEVTA